jgi:hypothetical protein
VEIFFVLLRAKKVIDYCRLLEWNDSIGSIRPIEDTKSENRIHSEESGQDFIDRIAFL